MSKVYLLSRASGRRILEDLRSGNEVAWEQIWRVPKTGAQVDGNLEDLSQELLRLRQTVPNIKSPNAGARFEAQGSVLLHSAMKSLPRALLADDDFWIWLSLYHCRDLIEWRHEADVGAAPANFGLENKWDGLLLRMFMRAEIVYDPTAEDPYRLARLGKQDFWRSHILRTSYGSCREFASAFVEVVYGGNLQSSSPNNDTIRALAKRLKQLFGGLTYEMLNRAQSAEVISRELGQLLA